MPDELRFSDWVRPRTRIARRADLLRFAGGQLSIDLAPARPWAPRSLDGAGAVRADAWRMMNSIIAQFGRGRKIWADQTALRARTRELDRAGALQLLDRRVGWGDGLTPAGDDFILGYLLGLRLGEAGGPGRTGFRSAVDRWVAHQFHRTTEVSETYLAAAAEGVFTDSMVRLALSATRRDGAELWDATRAVLALGHSSGTCTVDGFQHACASWSGF
jgi:hypothetical protein